MYQNSPIIQAKGALPSIEPVDPPVEIKLPWRIPVLHGDRFCAHV